MSAILCAISKCMRGWLGRCLLLAIVLAVFVAALAWIGQATRRGIFSWDRYAIDFAAIDCPTPPVEERDVFLAEVQYLSDFPDRLHLLEDGLTRRLAEAFARHPWVAKVERVEIGPQRQVHVDVSFRTPVLAVLTPESSIYIEVRAKESERTNNLSAALAVDEQGVLLPGAAVRAQLPVLRGITKAPAGPAGTLWRDDAVASAARTAAFLQPHQDLLGLNDLEVTGDGVVLSTPRIGKTDRPPLRVLWGRPPGSEQDGEAEADVKLLRLLEYRKKHSELGRAPVTAIDLRPGDQMRLLP